MARLSHRGRPIAAAVAIDAYLPITLKLRQDSPKMEPSALKPYSGRSAESGEKGEIDWRTIQGRNTGRFQGVIMNLFSYVLAADSGFAPTPFWGCCTLACCKPAIRRVGDVGDLIVGLTPKAKGNRVVYIMRVADKLTFAEYWDHPGFQCKKPFAKGNSIVSECGDNIYRPLPGQQFQQQRSRHSHHDGAENEETKRRDLGGKYVIVSHDFAYFGNSAIPLPLRFRSLVIGRGHRRFPSDNNARLIAAFSKFFDGLPRGRRGGPAKWATRLSCLAHQFKVMCSTRSCD